MVVPEGIQYQVQLVTGLHGSARGHSIPSPETGLGMPGIVPLKARSSGQISASMDLVIVGLW